MSGQGRGRGRGRGGGSGGSGGGRGKGRGRGGGGGSRPNSSSRPGARGRGPPSRRNSSASGGGGGGGGGGATKPKLINGQKGADVHTVSESDRIRFTQLLIDFREDHSRDSLTMPTDLTNTERKFLHSLAGQLGLKSKSSGKGENRCITVSRMSNIKKVAGASMGGGGNNGNHEDDDDSGLPVLRVGRQGLEALRSYCRRHPPSAVEEAESHMTGSSLLKSVLGIGNIGSNTCNGNDEQDGDDDDDAGDDVVMSTSAATAGDIMGTPSANASPEKTEEQVSILQALDELHISSTSQGPVKQAPRKQVDIPKRMALHRAAQMAKTKTKQYKQMQEGRKKLPAYSYRREVCDIVYGNRVTILSGDTGCGKSTQVPQFLLDDDRIGPTASIVVTQPRRISAISVAERVAAERGEECGKRGGLIGYSVRLESCACPSTQCLFVTPGVLLRRFQSSPDLAGVTHVVIDEIHERDKYTEFLMVALRNLMTLRDDLHVVLMSATIQTHELSVYWTGVGNVSGIPPVVPEALDEDDMDIDSGDEMVVSSGAPAEVSIPGRTYPVQEFFLEEILEMTGYVNDDGQRLGDQSELDRIDAELGALLQGSSASSGNSNKPRSGRGKKRKDAPTGDGSSLSCIMCGRSGFRSAEELGDHVALCDGGGGITMEALEDKVRSTNTASIVAFDEDIAAANPQFEEYDDGDGVFEEFGIEDDDIDDGDDDDDVAGLHHGKWDGESPFGIADVLSSSTTTLTQEEMLSRYQQMHDDEQIDDMLLLEVVRFICSSSYGDGAILIFLPGWAEISEFQLLLESTHPFNNKSKYSVLPLHSGIPSKEQRKVFMRPSKGVRKIVLATNIAETSITIDDVAFVCDTGRAKEKNYDPHLKTSTLQPVWISQASAKQRRGRAGRTKAGVCFHLFSRRRHASLRPFLESELLRTPLEEMCLQCKKLGLAPGGPEDDDGIPAFLAKALTPPHPKSITNAIELLVELGAMEAETNDLTNLGLCLSVLSLEPTVGKMIIWSHLLGCARAASSMGVAMSYKSPFVLPPSFLRKQADDAKVQLSENSESDQITVLNALRAKDGFSRRGGDGRFFDYCRRNFLGVSTLNMIGDLRRNISRELGSLGFPSTNESGYHNRNGENDPAFLQAAIAAGLYPNVASRRRGESNFSTVTNRKAKVHISSVNACKGQPLNGKSQIAEGDVEFIIYGEMTRGVSSFTMSNITHLASPLPLLLLCGSLRVRPAEIKEENDESGDNTIRKGGKGKKAVLSVDDWILFLCGEEEAANLVILRRRLDNAFLHLVANPSTGLTKLTPAEKDAVDTLGTVLRSAHTAAPGRRN